MSRDEPLLLDMLLAATDAPSFTTGLDQTQFNASRLHQAAVIRCLEIIGEYAAVRLDVVWNALQNDLPGLIATLRSLIPSSSDEESSD